MNLSNQPTNQYWHYVHYFIHNVVVLSLYTTRHLHMVDDGSFRRLRFGTAFPYGITNLRYLWFKWKGGMQHIRIYNGIILSFLQLENLRINKHTITEMPIGSPALAGSVLILDPASFIGYDNIAFDEGGFESSAFEGQLLGFPGYDQQDFRIKNFSIRQIA